MHTCKLALATVSRLCTKAEYGIAGCGTLLAINTAMRCMQLCTLPNIVDIPTVLAEPLTIVVSLPPPRPQHAHTHTLAAFAPAVFSCTHIVHPRRMGFCIGRALHHEWLLQGDLHGQFFDFANIFKIYG